MSQVTLFSTGQGSRERHAIKVCPKCQSNAIRYKHGGEGRFFVRCGVCNWYGSKNSLHERDLNQYERGR